MKKRDWLWLVALPLYHLIGTIRHESGHALMVLAQGGKINQLVIFPGVLNGHFYFGYTSFTGADTWLTTAGPYLLNLLTFTIFFAICMWLPFRRHWLWFNLVIIGLISPLFNSLYQYLKPVLGIIGDVPVLFITHLPDVTVHSFFILTLGLYLAGVVVVFRRARHLKPQGATHA